MDNFQYFQHDFLCICYGFIFVEHIKIPLIKY